jgi:hypothetical protein
MILYWQNVRNLWNHNSQFSILILFTDGFFLDVNEADSVYLDDIVFRDIHTSEQQEDLWLNQYYG